MREILFRGKRVKDGKWAESCCPLGEMHSGTVTWDFIRETVCQYTGLTDKNGRKIFEGDIVKIPFRRDFAVTKFGCPECQYVYQMQGDGDYIKMGEHGREVEVIGNIFDNPELIGIDLGGDKSITTYYAKDLSKDIEKEG
ncbi:MAG: YopX family protein [Ruminococcus flavefaciens]|nr:YopX family protein [Ruminococcus flavefaciens]